MSNKFGAITVRQPSIHPFTPDKVDCGSGDADARQIRTDLAHARPTRQSLESMYLAIPAARQHLWSATLPAGIPPPSEDEAAESLWRTGCGRDE
jgi:hypothetical protein